MKETRMNINIHVIEFESQKAAYKITTCNTLQFRLQKHDMRRPTSRKET